MPHDFSLSLTEIALPKRSKGYDVNALKKIEEQKLLAAVPSQSLIVALDEHGSTWSTTEFAQHVQRWMLSWSKVSFLVGGPDGLSAQCLQTAHHKWSLSPLTFPHPIVRILVAEQLYRVWSLLHHHPYHRA